MALSFTGNLSKTVIGLALVVGLALSFLSACARQSNSIILATTTSTYDSGILAELLPPFEKANHVKIEVVAVGTGQAIKLGEQGNADVLLVHDPTREAAFVAQGYGVNRQPVMYNDFVLVGPESDLAGVKGLKDAAQALTKIAQARASFISRGDDSGTHSKEKALWAVAGLKPSSAEGWYLSTGQGMGETLNMANEKGGYTLSDRGTFLSYRGKLGLTILVEGDPVLFNPYSVIAVNPEKYPHVKYQIALKFIDYLTYSKTQERIAQFGRAQYGQSLFFPNSQAAKGSAGQ